MPAGPAAASAAALDAAIAESHEKNADDIEVGEKSSQMGSESEDQIRTVFTDPQNFNVKHPLYNNWTLWFDNPSAKGLSNGKGGGKDSWGEDLNKVVDFDSVEEFWGLYSNIIPPTALPAKANYYLFKEGIKPAWEDPANSDGGKWSIQLPRDKNRERIDQLWLFTVSTHTEKREEEKEMLSDLIFADVVRYWRDNGKRVYFSRRTRTYYRRHLVCSTSLLPNRHLDRTSR